MFHAKLPILAVILSLATRQVHGQFSPVSVGPLQTCSLTTFTCLTGGCCTIGTCCGGGCCEIGYTCINEGTSDQACCPVGDETVCGTVTPDTTSDTDSDSSGSGNCIGLDNCPTDPERGLAWTCVLGETCGLSYPDCYPCIPSGGDGGDPSPTSNLEPPTSSDLSSSGDDSSSDSSGDSSGDSSDDSSNDSSGDSSDDPNSGYSLRDAHGKVSWHVAGLWLFIAMVA